MFGEFIRVERKIKSMRIDESCFEVFFCKIKSIIGAVKNKMSSYFERRTEYYFNFINVAFIATKAIGLGECLKGDSVSYTRLKIIRVGTYLYSSVPSRISRISLTSCFPLASGGFRILYERGAVSYTHLTLPTIYSV